MRASTGAAFAAVPARCCGAPRGGLGHARLADTARAPGMGPHAREQAQRHQRRQLHEQLRRLLGLRRLWRAQVRAQQRPVHGEQPL